MPKELKSKYQNRYSYDQPAIVSDRYRVSSRASAATANAALQDTEILADENILDGKKVIREKLWSITRISYPERMKMLVYFA